MIVSLNYRVATGVLLLSTIILGGLFLYDRFLAPARTVTNTVTNTVTKTVTNTVVVQTSSVAQGCSFVLYQNNSAFQAANCVPGGSGFRELNATALMADMQSTLGSSGGLILVQRGTWTLTSQWPTVDLSNLVVLSGLGPATLFQPGGAGGFDPINPNLVKITNLNMVDRYGIQVSFTCDLACLDRQQQSFPLDTYSPTVIGNTMVTFLGNYIRLDSQAAAFPAFETGYAVVFRNGTITSPPSSVQHSFAFKATLRTAQLKPFFPLFMEPTKGDYNNFIGFRWTSTTNLRLETHLNGASTMMNVAETMDSNDHTYELDYQCCAPSASYVVYKYDGVVIGTINTNIIPYPGSNLQTAPYGPELETCEPDGQIMALYLKTPFLTPVTI